jgi:hypothetical protein
VVEIRDGSGELVTGPVPITLTLTSPASGAVLSGSSVVMTTAGAATFAGLAIDLIGSGYQLTATSTDVQPATSTAFAVTGPISPATSAVTSPVSLLLVGDTATVTLAASDAAGTPLTTGGSAVTFSLAGGTAAGSFATTVDRGDGTYRALFTATAAGSAAQVQAAIDNVAVGTQPPALTVLGFASISAGQQHTCGVTTDNRALCWGRNVSGQLGQAGANSALPSQVEGARVWTGLAAGHRNTCGITEDDDAYCWGNNEYSQVGNGTSSVREDQPAAVSNGLSFARLAVSLGFSTTSSTLDQGFVNCGVTTTGQGYCWGDGRYGQIGNGSIAEQPVPAAVSGGLTFGSVAAGAMHSCGIITTGEPYCWGVNANGQLGIGNSSGADLCEGLVCTTTPTAAATPRVFDSGSIAVGTDHSCGLSEGLALCWGANRFGALGDGTSTARTSPVLVAGSRLFSLLSAGDAMTCGLTPEGDTYCWGRSSGPGLPRTNLLPTLVSGGFRFQQIDAGGGHACGIIASGAAYCWGSNASGQLGTGNLISTFTPLRVRMR